MAIKHTSSNFRRGLEVGLTCGAMTGGVGFTPPKKATALTGALCKAEIQTVTTRIQTIKPSTSTGLTIEEYASLLEQIPITANLPYTTKVIETLVSGTTYNSIIEIDIQMSSRYKIRLWYGTNNYAGAGNAPMITGRGRYYIIPIIDGVQLFSNLYAYIEYTLDNTASTKTWYANIITFPQVVKFAGFIIGGYYWIHFNDEVFMARYYYLYNNRSAYLSIVNNASYLSSGNIYKFFGVDTASMTPEDRDAYRLNRPTVTISSVPVEVETIQVNLMYLREGLNKVTNLTDPSDYAYIWSIGNNANYILIDYL